jgi:hypothetical protein
MPTKTITTPDKPRNYIKKRRRINAQLISKNKARSWEYVIGEKKINVDRKLKLPPLVKKRLAKLKN